MSAVSEELIQKMLRGEGYSEELESRIKDVEVTAEEGQRISDSLLLNAHKSFYQSWGPTAWRVIPDYISSNAFIASSYSKLIISYVKDLLWNDKLHLPNETSEEVMPIDIWIVELGAGTGNLAYLLIRALSFHQNTLFLRRKGKKYPISFKFVITDYVEQNVQYWCDHGYFDGFIQRGLVDFAVFNVLEDKELHLKFSKKILNKQNLNDNPIIFVGNYLLDTLPHDAFSIKHNELFEVLLNYKVPTLPENPLFLSEALKKNKWSRKLVFPPSLYDDDIFTEEQLKDEEARRQREEGDNPSTRPLPPEFLKLMYYSENQYSEANLYNEILDDYRLNFDGTCASVLLPIGGFQMIKNLRESFGDSMLLLLGDKGEVSLSNFEGYFSPPLNLQGGSLSFLSNFHAIQAYWEKVYNNLSIPSKSFLADSSDEFKVCIFTSGLENDEISELSNAFKECNQFTPDDYYRVYRSVNENIKPKAIHSLLRLSCNDPSMFYQYKDTLLQLLPKSSWKQSIIQELLRTWGNYYHRVSAIEEDIPYALGEIFLACKRPKEAIPFFKKSLELSGNYYSTHYNLGVCYEKLGNISEALENYKACSKSEMDMEYDETAERIEYLENIINQKENQKKMEEKKRKDLIDTYKKEEERKSKKNSRERVIEREESNQNLLSNSMNARMAKFNKYGATTLEEKNEEPEDEDEDEEDEEDEEIIDDDYDDPLLLM